MPFFSGTACLFTTIVISVSDLGFATSGTNDPKMHSFDLASVNNWKVYEDAHFDAKSADSSHHYFSIYVQAQDLATLRYKRSQGRHHQQKDLRAISSHHGRVTPSISIAQIISCQALVTPQASPAQGYVHDQ